MFALLGLPTIVALFVVIPTKRMSTLVALIAITVTAALAGDFGLNTGKFIIGGLKNAAPWQGCSSSPSSTSASSRTPACRLRSSTASCAPWAGTLEQA